MKDVFNNEDYNWGKQAFRLYNSKIRQIHSYRVEKLINLLNEKDFIIKKKNILEIGSSDLFFLANLCENNLIPDSYTGLDVWWENSQGYAIHNKNSLENKYPLRINLKTSACEEFKCKENMFDTVIALETIEHVKDENICLNNIIESLNIGGYLIITVPVEFGILFGLKEFMRMVLKRKLNYNVGEFLNAILGRLHKVKRIEHKGYDYRKTINTLEALGLKIIYEVTYPFNVYFIDYGYMGIFKKLR